ncbi:hypothetical protein AAHA92_30825 [Salvia divinorum]|uniref:Uncharacterized protein n=1 Tax=Salvia divinorum TaxID=28513 RepID=A0ABD1FS44_SALDI
MLDCSSTITMSSQPHLFLVLRFFTQSLTDREDNQSGQGFGTSQRNPGIGRREDLGLSRTTETDRDPEMPQLEDWQTGDPIL